MIEKVTTIKFRTSDGRTFDSEDDAKQYESVEGTLKELLNVLAVSAKTGRVESVLRELIVEETTIRQILARHHKRTTKRKPAEVRVAA